jgi:hypothetical protein
MNVEDELLGFLVAITSDMLDDELRASLEQELMNAEWQSGCELEDEGLILCHIIGSLEVEANHIYRSCSLSGETRTTSAPQPWEWAKSSKNRTQSAPVKTETRSLGSCWAASSRSWGLTFGGMMGSKLEVECC